MILSLRAYARHRHEKGLPGGSLIAVQTAIKSGRLRGSLTKDGKIQSARAADHEWLLATKADYVPLTGPTAPSLGAKNGHDGERSEAAPVVVNDLATARARREAAAADLAEIELAEKRGELLDKREVEATWADHILRARTRFLALPSRLREQVPEVGERVFAVAMKLVEEGLEELAAERDSA